MQEVEAIVAFFGPLVVLASVLVSAWTRRWLGRAFLAAVVLLAVAWSLAAAAQLTGFRAADVWWDCWPSCTLLQQVVGATFLYAPVDAVVLAILANVLAAVDRRRKRGPLLP